MSKYTAEIEALNADKIGCRPYGAAEITQEGDTLRVMIEMNDVPANCEHWQHLHGFADGSPAEVATQEQDTNHDGYIDLPETEPVSGVTMVPFNSSPAIMNIPNNTYPIADADGHYFYEMYVSLKELKRNFAKAFGTDDLQLDKRVIYIHGVPKDLKLPDTVGGNLEEFDAHVTLPIAAGKLTKVE